LCVVASKRLFAARRLNKPFWVDPRGFEPLVAATLCAMRYFALTYFW
jgi:hypothetical protein